MKKLNPYRQLKQLLKAHSSERQQAACALVAEVLKLNMEPAFMGCITHAFSMVNSDSAARANELAVHIQREAYRRTHGRTPVKATPSYMAFESSDGSFRVVFSRLDELNKEGYPVCMAADENVILLNEANAMMLLELLEYIERKKHMITA
jgi:hypothetical protein